MIETYEHWEAVNEVLGRFPFTDDVVVEMAARIVELEAEVRDLKNDLDEIRETSRAKERKDSF